MHDQSTDDLTKIVWDYMLLREKPKKSDGIFCLGSHDSRVANRAAELMLEGYGKYLVFSGGKGRLTSKKSWESEASLFARIAIDMGVPQEKILIENKSSNTSENILFTYDLLKENHKPCGSLILVQKPYMERRTYATFKKQWPEPATQITVTSPLLAFDEYCNKEISKVDVINIMVGDLQRIKVYPEYGYQIEQAIPEGVWEAYNELVKRGFDKQLIGANGN